jgi:hypothetical protein
MRVSAHRGAPIVETSPGSGSDLHPIMTVKENGVLAFAWGELVTPYDSYTEITKAHPTL